MSEVMHSYFLIVGWTFWMVPVGWSWYVSTETRTICLSPMKVILGTFLAVVTLLWTSDDIGWQVMQWDPYPSDSLLEFGVSARTVAEKILLPQAVVLESVGIQRFSEVKPIEAIWLRSSISHELGICKNLSCTFCFQGAEPSERNPAQLQPESSESKSL